MLNVGSYNKERTHKMRRILILFTITIFIIGCITSKQLSYFNTINIEKNLFMDQYEVNVEAWLSYYSWIYKNNGKKEALKVLPDSSCVGESVWFLMTNQTNYYNENALSSITTQPIGYFSSEHFDSINTSEQNRSFNEILMYPITGLTYEQVTNFCHWRTDVSGRGIVSYRLPTEAEWKGIAEKQKTGYENLKNYNDSTFNEICRVYNYKITKRCQHLIKNNILKAKLDIGGSYNPGQVKLYDLFGNVSEMTSLKGIAKGGNYLLYASQCSIDSIQNYDKPERWLGFRCVLVDNK